ncbi:MAG: SUMF1/EgtB/PvdO family nonheme iron enzyme [Lachnospiraceae bacterium]|nr:SUMF1/EgtB/PvdO family nonheme iron enzyme [Lachnospiraceae bacterium]
MANFDEIKFTIESLSGGKNTVLFDDMEMPSIMVPINKFKCSDVIAGGSDNIHPAFSVGGVEKDVIYASKFQNVVVNNRAYSLAGKDPKANINFDTALTYCRNKGKGWCLTPYALWAAIALWCRKNGTMPRGNNNYGQDHSYTLEKGTPSSLDNGRVGRCLTGSGPNTWSHNWMPDGIFDLNGNVSEWCAGMRIYDGEIQIIPYSNIFDPEVSNSATSTAWKAIKADGTLVEPGTNGTLHYDWISSKLTLSDGEKVDWENTSRYSGYASMTLASGLEVPEIVKSLILYPDEPGGDYGGDSRYVNPVSERLPGCGGYWNSGASAGVFCVFLHNLRSYSTGNIGFRSAFVDL